MSWMFIDLILCALIYAFLILVFFVRNEKKKGKASDDDDGEGGIPEVLPPDFDLPPGICLPDDPRLKYEKEDVFA